MTTITPPILLLLTLTTALLNAKATSTNLSAFLNRADDEDAKNAFLYNSTTILRILQRVNYLTIYLIDHQDYGNSLVRFLIEQKSCAVKLFFRSLATGIERTNAFKALNIKFRIHQRHRAVFVREARQLSGILEVFATRAGSLICIIGVDMDLADLLKLAKLLWHERGIYRVFYFLSTRGWFFNPFLIEAEAKKPLTLEDYGAFVDANAWQSEQQIFENMHGYVVRTYIFDSVYSTVYGNLTTKKITSIHGADSEAALLLSDKMNFTMEFQWPDDEFFGSRQKNGSFNGAIGRLLRSETDVILSGFFVKDYLTKDITFTVSVYMDELCCYVMKARRIPQSILPLFAVRLDIWFGFLLVGLLSPLIWMLIRYLNLNFTAKNKCWRESTNDRMARKLIYRPKYQYARIFIDTWVIWVRVNILRFPTFYSERVFVASLSLVSVIYGALFESSLATVYIRPLYYKDINTLDELDRAGFRIYIKHGAMKDDLFYGHSSEVYQNLERRLLLVAETEERLISMMSKRGGFAAVTRASSLILDDIRYFITKKIHKIPECPKNYHIAFVLPRHSPYEEAFNLHLLRFVQAGFMDQWIGESKHKAKTKIHTFPDYNDETGNHWKVLTLKDLQLSFYALCFGSVFAFLSLSLEIFWRNKYNALFAR